jgi:Zn finger protein HypA/HybF involved in hydrogenase expression
LLEKEKYLGDWNIDLSYVDIEDVKSMPSADVRENKHGEWLKHSYYKGVLICSDCNHGSNMYDKDFNFCPNCGAKMDKAESEDKE